MKHITAAFFLVAFLCCTSVPVLAEEAQDLNRQRKIDNIRILKEKTHSEAAEAAEQITEPGTTAEVSVTRVFQGLGLCIAAFLISVHFYKKYVLKSSAAPTRSIKIIERTQISPKSHLCLVEVMEKRILVAVGSDQVSFFKENEVFNSYSNFDLTSADKADVCKSEIN